VKSASPLDVTLRGLLGSQAGIADNGFDLLILARQLLGSPISRSINSQERLAGSQVERLNLAAEYGPGQGVSRKGKVEPEPAALTPLDLLQQLPPRWDIASGLQAPLKGSSELKGNPANMPADRTVLVLRNLVPSCVHARALDSLEPLRSELREGQISPMGLKE